MCVCVCCSTALPDALMLGVVGVMVSLITFNRNLFQCLEAKLLKNVSLERVNKHLQKSNSKNDKITQVLLAKARLCLYGLKRSPCRP